MYLHCKECIKELKNKWITPKEYARIEAILTQEENQTYITLNYLRHKKLIGNFVIENPNIKLECENCKEKQQELRIH